MDDFSFMFMYMGFIALSLSLKRHSRQVFSGKILSSKQTILLQITGWVGLIISLVICMKQQGNAVGIVFWVGLLSAAILIQTLILTYKPERLTGIAIFILTFSLFLKVVL